jgi:hypothetical protein
MCKTISSVVGTLWLDSTSLCGIWLYKPFRSSACWIDSKACKSPRLTKSFHLSADTCALTREADSLRSLNMYSANIMISSVARSSSPFLGMNTLSGVYILTSRPAYSCRNMHHLRHAIWLPRAVLGLTPSAIMRRTFCSRLRRKMETALSAKGK